ncbi:MAG: hypothetical protein ACK4UN_19955 [Limisphaerales bacterium]
MSVKPNPKFKLVRIVLASTVGSLLWAGCAQPQWAVPERQTAANAPVDLTIRRPDTHPHLRSGMWYGPASANVAVIPVPGASEIPGPVGADALVQAPGSIIVEGAGAEPAPSRKTWRERWFKRAAPESGTRIEREVIIEQTPQPVPEPYRPSKEELEEEGGKLMDTHFAKR